MTSENEEDRTSRVSLWRSGHRLTSAWAVFGDERQKSLQVEAMGTPSSLVYQELMMMDIYGQIADGVLIAYGYRTEPTISDGPVRIPADVFEEPLTDSWLEDVIQASGYRYERVKIIAEVDVPVAQDIETRTPPNVMRGRGGRRNTYSMSKMVITALFAENPSLGELSAERLHPAFSTKYREIHAEAANRVPPPSERTLRDQLRRYRSEETGKNRQE